MASDNLQQRPDKGMYDTPLVNPEEQHEHVSTSRECYRLPMAVAKMKDTQNQQHLLGELAKHPEVTVLLNGKVFSDPQSTYIKLLNQHDAIFKIVNSFVENGPDSLDLLLAEKHAVDEPVIDVTEEYPQATETPKEEPRAKKGFWQKLFHS